MTRLVKNLAVVALFVCGGLLMAGCVQSQNKMASARQLPPAAAAAIQKNYPNATVHDVKTEDEDGVKILAVKLHQDKARLEVKMTESGTILETETAISIDQLPKAVVDAVAKAAPGAKITKAAKTEEVADVKKGKLAKPEIGYDVEVTINGKEGELEVAPDGKIVEPLKWEDHKEGKGEKKENKEHENR